MATDTVHTILNLAPTADFDTVERAFIDHVKDQIQHIAESYDEEMVRAQEQYLRRAYPLFFDYSVQWAAMELKHATAQPGRGKDHPDAPKLKAEARNVLKDLQTNITAFAIVYMHINRFMTLVRDEIKKEEGRALNISGRKIKWTSDAGVTLARNQKRKKQLLALNARYTDARAKLEGVEPAWRDITADFATLFSAEDAEGFERSLRAALRVADFSRLRVVTKNIAEAKTKFTLDRQTTDQSRLRLEKNLSRLMEFYYDNSELLTGEDGRLFLRHGELSIALDSQQTEIRKINGFIMKYSLPYMEYKLATLSHLRDKLMIIGALENLMTLYHKLVVGMARPLPNLESVREFESGVIEHIRYLQSAFFKEMPAIYQDCCKVVEEFRAAQSDYHENLRRAADEGIDLSDAGDDDTDAGSVSA